MSTLKGVGKRRQLGEIGDAQEDSRDPPGRRARKLDCKAC
jgi:hypothetical protein